MFYNGCIKTFAWFIKLRPIYFISLVFAPTLTSFRAFIIPIVFLRWGNMPHYSHYIVLHSFKVSWVRAYCNSIKVLQSITFSVSLFFKTLTSFFSFLNQPCTDPFLNMTDTFLVLYFNVRIIAIYMCNFSCRIGLTISIWIHFNISQFLIIYRPWKYSFCSSNLHVWSWTFIICSAAMICFEIFKCNRITFFKIFISIL